MKNLLLAVAVLSFAAAPTRSRAAGPDEVDVFVAGEGGYNSYRIPAMVVTPKGTVLAFCEGRKAGRADTGDIDLLVRRSADGGKSFDKPQVVWDDGANTCGNPCPIVDRKTGAVVLLMTRNLGSDSEKEIKAGTSKGTRTVWITRSEDDGRTWSAPVDISADLKRPAWTWYATGPGAGIQTKAGRLIAPCDFMSKDGAFSHVIYSDDGGKHWTLGGVVGPTTNESRVVELSDGRLMLNMRNHGGDKKVRAVAQSKDAGATWSPVTYDQTLVEPACQASLIRVDGKKDARPTFLFANPAAERRVRMTVRLSEDDCKTWAKTKELWAGPAAYSDLAVAGDGTVLCLYERGKQHAYERIVLARFGVGWLGE